SRREACKSHERQLEVRHQPYHANLAAAVAAFDWVRQNRRKRLVLGVLRHQRKPIGLTRCGVWQYDSPRVVRSIDHATILSVNQDLPRRSKFLGPAGHGRQGQQIEADSRREPLGHEFVFDNFDPLFHANALYLLAAELCAWGVDPSIETSLQLD